MTSLAIHAFYSCCLSCCLIDRRPIKDAVKSDLYFNSVAVCFLRYPRCIESMQYLSVKSHVAWLAIIIADYKQGTD